jgi:hypothetical protein
MGQSEPPSPCSKCLSFFIGQDSRGNWVVQDQEHLRGGLFINRGEAIKFALFENGHRPQDIVTVPGVFDLDMNSKTGTAPVRARYVNALHERRAA